MIPDLIRAVCEDCKADLGGYVSDKTAYLVVRRHKLGEFYSKCQAGTKQAEEVPVTKPKPKPKPKSPPKPKGKTRTIPKDERVGEFLATCPCGEEFKGRTNKIATDKLNEHLLKEDHIHHVMDVKIERLA